MSTSPVRAVASDKLKRQRAIRAVVKDHAIASQGELARHLARLGFDVTQATLSRDIKELRIHRVPDGDAYRYTEGANGSSAEHGNGQAEARRMKSVATLEVVGIDSNETCVVVRTLTGRAQGVAVWLDGLGYPELLATIAGDDTVLVVPRSIRQTARLKNRLAAALGS